MVARGGNLASEIILRGCGTAPLWFAAETGSAGERAQPMLRPGSQGHGLGENGTRPNGTLRRHHPGPKEAPVTPAGSCLKYSIRRRPAGLAWGRCRPAATSSGRVVAADVQWEGTIWCGRRKTLSGAG